MTAKHGKKELYPRKDVAQVLMGIPIVMTIAVIVANFATSYAGIY